MRRLALAITVALVAGQVGEAAGQRDVLGHAWRVTRSLATRPFVGLRARSERARFARGTKGNLASVNAFVAADPAAAATAILRQADRSAARAAAKAKRSAALRRGRAWLRRTALRLTSSPLALGGYAGVATMFFGEVTAVIFAFFGGWWVGEMTQLWLGRARKS